MPKVSRTYRIEQETADRIADISESEGKTATEVVEAAIRAYSSEEYAGNTAKQADSPALAALIDQLAKKDEQIAKLMETVADSTKAVQGAPKPKPRPGGGSASQQQTQRRKEQPSHERNPNIGQDR